MGVQLLGIDLEVAHARIESARAKLFAHRDTRVRPGLDDKILTAWNGLMIRGMAVAARHLQRPELAESAADAVSFLRRTLWRDGRLYVSFKDGRGDITGYLDDYAFLADALLEVYQFSGDTGYLKAARELVEQVGHRCQHSLTGMVFRELS